MKKLNEQQLSTIVGGKKKKGNWFSCMMMQYSCNTLGDGASCKEWKRKCT